MRVAGLLAHYWTGNDDKATRRAQIIDWVDDLKEFPIGAIEGAVITWRRTQTKRPTPADIRRLILPEPKTDQPGGTAYTEFPKSRLTSAQRAKHRQAIAPLWGLVRRAMAGEDPEKLIAERHRMSAEMFAKDPELKIINDLVEQEIREERKTR